MRFKQLPKAIRSASDKMYKQMIVGLKHQRNILGYDISDTMLETLVINMCTEWAFDDYKRIKQMLKER